MKLSELKKLVKEVLGEETKTSEHSKENMRSVIASLKNGYIANDDWTKFLKQAETARKQYADSQRDPNVVKSAVTIAGKKFLPNFSKNIGLTSIKIKNGQLVINHGGNMGNTIERSVDPNIARVGLPSVKELKKMYNVLSEKGSPDYNWTIIFDLTKSK